jgi:hypothetical protein
MHGGSDERLGLASRPLMHVCSGLDCMACKCMQVHASAQHLQSLRCKELPLQLQGVHNCRGLLQQPCSTGADVVPISVASPVSRPDQNAITCICNALLLLLLLWPPAT